MKNEIIRYDSDKAAQKRTVTGWVSSNNHFYGDNEHIARYDGCTHVICNKCQGECQKPYTVCEECRSEINSYLKMPFKEWDEETPLVFDGEHYFYDYDDIADYCYNKDIEMENLELIICEESKLHNIDGDELFEDILPEHYSLEDCSPEIFNAIKELNKAIDNNTTPFSWGRGKFRTTVRQKLLT